MTPLLHGPPQALTTACLAHPSVAWIAAPTIVGLAIGFALGASPGAASSTPTEASVSGAIQSQDVIALSPAEGIDVDHDGVPDLAAPAPGGLRGVDAYGSGAFGASRDGGRRVHLGADYAASPGEPVRAPVAGVVTRIGYAYGGDWLTFVEIEDSKAQQTARVFYLEPFVAQGEAVGAGTVIGAAQDLSRRYPFGMTNHVHVELSGRQGEWRDPAAVLPAPT